MDREAWQAMVCGVTKQRVGHNWATIIHMRVKHDLKRQTFSQLVGKSEYPSPKWLKMQQNNKDDDEWQWRPLTAVCGHSCNFQITQKESSSDAVVRQDSEMPGPQFHTILKSTRLCSRKNEEKTSQFWKKYSEEAEALDKQQPGKRSNIFNLSCLVLSFNEDFIY